MLFCSKASKHKEVVCVCVLNALGINIKLYPRSDLIGLIIFNYFQLMIHPIDFECFLFWEKKKGLQINRPNLFSHESPVQNVPWCIYCVLFFLHRSPKHIDTDSHDQAILPQTDVYHIERHPVLLTRCSGRHQTSLPANQEPRLWSRTYVVLAQTGRYFDA